jgi:hypothetical protein
MGFENDHLLEQQSLNKEISRNENIKKTILSIDTKDIIILILTIICIISTLYLLFH